MADNMIDITGVDLKELVKAAYDLSQPQGLGFLHYTTAPLTNAEAEQLIATAEYGDVAVSLDYVKGRACKLTVFRNGDTLTMCDSWYDHTPSQMKELLQRVGLPTRR